MKVPPHIVANPEAAKLFRRLAKSMTADGPAAVDLLAQYVTTKLFIEKAHAELATQPMLVEGRTGGMKANPLITALQRATHTNFQVAKRLGLVGDDKKQASDFADLGV